MIKRFLIALQFLTILPVSIKSEIEDKDFGASLLYFPFVGLFIGFILAGSAFLFSSLPSLLKSALVLIFSIIITGGIHLDGFADTCDGFYGNKSKEKILEIMRDSHIGVMGAIGISCLLILKFSLIISLQNEILWKALIGMAEFSRWAQALACSTSSYARKEGEAKYFIEYARKSDIFIGALFSVVLFLLLMRLKGFILFFLSTIMVFLFLHYINKKIGGMTGDTIGATSEIAEVVVLFCAFILMRINL